MNINNNEIKLVIFDMDGTIFDTERLGVESWLKASKDIGVELPYELLIKKIGLNSRDSLKLFQDYGIDEPTYKRIKEIKRKYVKKYINLYGTPLKSGVLELINELKNQNKKIALATSRGQEMTNFYLHNSVLDGKFDYVLTGDLIKRGKPYPDIFCETAKHFNVEPKKCIVIEDSENGVKAGMKAGMNVIFIPDLQKEISEITHTYTSMYDVLKLLK